MRDRSESHAERRRLFEATAIPFMRTVYSRALSLAGKREDAADLTQDTYLRAYRAFDHFTAGTNCRAWLLTILYSIFINRYHRQQLEPESMPVEEIERRFQRAVVQETESRVGDPHFWASEEVGGALARLKESFRTIILMVDVDELSYEEAAEALHCPVGTVRSRLSRARRILYAELQEYARRTGYLGGGER
jgi:RNA polymerase sigma-70 factor, ECF subfamily